MANKEYKLFKNMIAFFMLHCRLLTALLGCELPKYNLEILNNIWCESYKKQKVMTRWLLNGHNVTIAMVSDKSSNSPPCVASLN